MNRRNLVLTMAVLLSLTTVMGLAGNTASASGVWVGPSGGAGWQGFMQVIMQQDYRMQMSNGNPYWNTLMLPVSEATASAGMSTSSGQPAFGFCPLPGQCYMVLVQRPLASSSMATCPPLPVVPGQTAPNQPGKPNSLW